VVDSFKCSDIEGDGEKSRAWMWQVHGWKCRLGLSMPFPVVCVWGTVEVLAMLQCVSNRNSMDTLWESVWWVSEWVREWVKKCNYTIHSCERICDLRWYTYILIHCPFPSSHKWLLKWIENCGHAFIGSIVTKNSLLWLIIVSMVTLVATTLFLLRIWISRAQ
jgi:hypothetical protein